MIWQDNGLVCGIDEVGRGCLSGPLVTGAVILYPGPISRKVKDSKMLDHDELLEGYDWIIKNSWYATSILHHRVVDQINIYQTTLRAMKRAALQLLAASGKTPKAILVDAMPLKFEGFTVHHFPFGEHYSSSIAAASIVAKVTRDRIMQKMSQSIPGYLFEKNKGYATPEHKQCIRNLGESFVHRQTFLKKLIEEESNENQQSIW